ncbi:unnamed protein product [Clonostachys rhizophaga]|uniref:Uncharacterized protein n=1 Tax=Clonostachys rhizophaga TaxID=160324 RepID=A0A9N9VD74_9HYPO|nr:unnamed protein product [Clonostachys rhizophaga]
MLFRLLQYEGIWRSLSYLFRRADNSIAKVEDSIVILFRLYQKEDIWILLSYLFRRVLILIYKIDLIILIQKGTNINTEGREYSNTLQAALAGEYLEITELLIQKGRGFYNNTLQTALVRGYLEITQILIQKGADINTQGGKYSNTLQAVSAGGHLEIAEILVQNGADSFAPMLI